MLHIELSVHPEVRERFLREGYLANAVGHDGVVRVLDDDVAEDGSLFLVTELLDGETLEERRIRCGGQLSEDEVLSIADQLLDILAAAHAKRVVHRDLKPANIFLTAAGQVKVLDFGIARLREYSSTTHATRSGAAMGTPSFMPPEQARGLGEDVDAQSDLWACGATMYHALAGRPVHEGRTANEVLLAAMTMQAQPVASVVPGLSIPTSQLIDRALAYTRAGRWPDAKAMQDAVRNAYHQRHGSSITTAPPLAVPESIRGGELANPLPTTGRPVSNSRDPAAQRQPRVLLAAIGAGLGLAAMATVVLVKGYSGGASNSVAPVEPSALPTTVVAPPPIPVATEVAAVPPPTATDFGTSALGVAPPNPVSTAPRHPPAVHPSSVRPSTASSATGKPDCNPPYVVEASTGKKMWKVECL